MADHRAQHLRPCREHRLLRTPPRRDVKGVVAVRILALFERLDRGDSRPEGGKRWYRATSVLTLLSLAPVAFTFSGPSTRAAARLPSTREDESAWQQQQHPHPF
jgi:hypothetical protein